MFAKIIPLTKLPREMGVFDYEVPEKLKEKIAIGQLVEIPWRNTEKKGVVAAVYTEKPQIKTKKILRILDKEPFLYKAQLDLAQWASFYYCVSPAIFFKMIMPEIPKLRPGTVGTRHCLVPTEKLKILKSELPKIQHILKKISEQQKILFHWQNQNNKNAIYIKLLEKLSDFGQVILIFPQLNNIKNFSKYLPMHLWQKTSILHSELPFTVYWNEWNKIRKNNKGIIIGTRQAIFSPTKNLNTVIIDDEHNSSHKQWDQNPRYHSLECAKKIQELTGAKLILSSPVPSVETYLKTQKNGYTIITEGEVYKPFLPADIKLEIIQMQDEWRNGNCSVISRDTMQLLDKNLSKKKLSIIYLNRRGKNKFVICKDCGYIPVCPNCNLPLTVYNSDLLDQNLMPRCPSPLTNEKLPYDYCHPIDHHAENQKITRGELRCHHCGYEQAQTIPCPKCLGTNARYVGTGTQKIENEIKKNFPSVKIGRIDLDMPKSKKTMQKDMGTFDILIGTTSLLSYNLYRKSELVIFLNIDTDLMVSSAKAYERVIQNVKDFSLLLGDEGVLLIQTYSANNPIINFLKNCDFAKYYKEALIQREKISFPPFSQFIKLTYKHNNSKIVEFESEKLLDILLRQFASDKRVSILGPVALPQRFKKFAQEIVIKNCGNHEDMQKWLIDNISANWIIDVDPIEI